MSILQNASQDELQMMLVAIPEKTVPQYDLNTLPPGIILRLRTHHHWKYLLEADSDGYIHVVLSDVTGSVGSAKYRGRHLIEKGYTTLAVNNTFKYGKLLTAILAEIAILAPQ